MSTADTKAQITLLIAGFQREVPALEKLKLVFELELRGRGDIQLFRVEVPGPKITRDIASDAKVRSGPPEILKLIANVVLKQEERTRTRRLSARNHAA